MRGRAEELFNVLLALLFLVAGTSKFLALTTRRFLRGF